MVQLLPESPYSNHGPSSPFHQPAHGRSKPTADGAMSQEEHAQKMKELNAKRSMMRTPRRGWSMTDYQGDATSPSPFQPVTSSMDHEVSIPENEALGATTPVPSEKPLPNEAGMAFGQRVQLPQRPKLPAPRRSYSVTDYEPVPRGLPLPSKNINILNLPSEIHYAFFDFLDPIDGASFGLTHSSLYDIHRRKNGKVPLSSRYSGPNDMEWAWRGAGPLKRGETPQSAKEKAKEQALEQLRVKGQVYCRKCGISRCELHRHIKEWMGPGYEYCEIKQIYGKPAGEDKKQYCYMSSPTNPHRCGRHGSKRTVAI